MRHTPRGPDPYWGEARRRSGAAAFGIACLVVVVLAAIWVAVPLVQLARLAHPPRRVAPVTPARVGLAFATASFDNRSNTALLSGWWIPAPGGNGATAILVAGQGQNRLLGGAGLPLAQALQGQGWNVLMYDPEGTGQSQAGVALPGPAQVDDALGAVRYARYHIAQAAPVVLIGEGWGGSVALLAGQESSSVSGVLADSPFASLAPLLNQNLATWTHLPRRLFQGVLLRAWPWVTGIDPAAVNPLAGMALLGRRPVLLISGANAAPAILADVRQLHGADAASHLWLAPNAGSLQAWTHDRTAYLTHLATWLRLAAGGPTA